ncbi:Type I secretion system membrane fusion protein PrsE [Methylobrevis pamukkalensis]|uniref:Membrane fusion protein (MFP) family protein n=1 Tax=Methylobrevis pamukkalensis TaxID=1439726 RepID=A0A1E3GPI6_9HYPH|nr:Type I secretion system membrane fusion protein PrsE [Methylobrevis pamukkalensis]
MRLIGVELEGLRTLWEKKLVSLQRITASERDAARLTGEKGQLVAAQAQVEGKVSETRLQILQIDQDMRTEVAQELRTIDAEIGEYIERKAAAEDQLVRIDIRAPQTGVIHQLAVHTIGGVIQAGETMMLIVPVADDLRVEARIAPQDIDQVAAGQHAVMRLSAFNQQVTPELAGTVEDISPDLTQDQQTGVSYYTVRIQITPEEIARLGDLRIVPGMPAEAFIQTNSRTILSYLVKPLEDQIERAFREE